MKFQGTVGKFLPRMGVSVLMAVTFPDPPALLVAADPEASGLVTNAIFLYCFFLQPLDWNDSNRHMTVFLSFSGSGSDVREKQTHKKVI